LEGRLEYYDVGGDPKELMAYMVKSKSSPFLPLGKRVKKEEGKREKKRIKRIEREKGQ
jgi:hypothetical protein